MVLSWDALRNVTFVHLVLARTTENVPTVGDHMYVTVAVDGQGKIVLDHLEEYSDLIEVHN